MASEGSRPRHMFSLPGLNRRSAIWSFSYHQEAVSKIIAGNLDNIALSYLADPAKDLYLHGEQVFLITFPAAACRSIGISLITATNIR